MNICDPSNGNSLELRRAPSSSPALFKTDNVVLGNRRGKTHSRPRLWTAEQYSPRSLRINPKYLLQKAPDVPPLIAIVTPSLNQGGLIAATIDSVLSQNYPNLAYHIQDGGSNDETIAVLKSYGNKIQWQSEPDAGQASAINLGFRKISGDIMAYLNSDDTLLPGTLSYVARTFDENPSLDFIYGHRIFVDIHGSEIGRCVLPSHDPEALKWADYIPQETMFWRKGVWQMVGPMDESFQFALDWDFILRAQTRGFNFRRVPRFLGCFRVHDAQKTVSMQDVGSDEMKRIRTQYLGFVPSPHDINRAIAPYLVSTNEV